MRIIRTIIGVIALGMVAASAQATTYYVRKDGSNANAGTSNTAGGAWLTIAKCATSTLVSGDICRVQVGNYVEVVSPTRSGTAGAGNTVTIVADGAVTICGMSVNTNSYVRIVGFVMTPSLSGCSNNPIVAFVGTSTGVEFWNDDIGTLNGYGFKIDFNGTGEKCNACIFVGGAIHDIGNPSAFTGMLMQGDDDFVAYARFSAICYLGIGPAGNRHRYLGLLFSGLLGDTSGCPGTGLHPDDFYIAVTTLGYSNGLIDGMFVVGTPTDTDNKIYHAQNDSTMDWNDNIVRFSVTYNMGSASSHSIYTSSTGNINRWRQYNNTHYLGDRGVSGSSFDSCGGGNNISTGTESVYFYNSIYDGCWAAGNTANLRPLNANWAYAAADHNLSFDPSNPTDTFGANWTGQAHAQTNIDPQFNNAAGQDFTLKAASGARGTGGPLTTASGSGVSSTSLVVATNTGSFFVGSNATNLPQYGGNLVPGDFITVGSTTVQVSSVSGDTLTLTSPISWNNGDTVCYGASCTVDIGAYPYKSGGYALSATYHINGSTATIIPNDSTLVRFVVCYDSSVPIAVVNTAPYTCPIGSGIFSARVYPRYASITLGTDAVPAGAGRYRFLRNIPPGN